MAFGTASSKSNVGYVYRLGTVSAGVGSGGNPSGSNGTEWNYQTSGTAAGEANQHYVSTGLVVSSGSPVTLDLNGGTLKQPGGEAFSITKIVELQIINRNTSGTATLTVGGASNPVANVAAVLGPGTTSIPGDVLKISSPNLGLTVTAATADEIKLTSSSGDIAVDVVIVGRG